MTEAGDGSISAALRTWTARDPDRPAITEIVFDGAQRRERTITRAELERSTNRLARHMRDAGWVSTTSSRSGCRTGSRSSRPRSRRGSAVPRRYPISYRLPERERDAIIELAEPKLVVVVPIEPAPELSDDPLPDDPIAASWKAPTSGGSTGRPKLIVSGAPATADPDREGPFGMGLDGVHARARAAVPQRPVRRSRSTALLDRQPRRGDGALRRRDALAADRRSTACNSMMLVPTMMQRIWRLPDEVRDRYDLSSLERHPAPRRAVPGVAQAGVDRVARPRARCWELYAGTEAQGVTVISGTEWLEHRARSASRASRARCASSTPTATSCRRGEIGEVWMRPTGRQPTYRYIGAEARAPRRLGVARRHRLARRGRLPLPRRPAAPT